MFDFNKIDSFQVETSTYCNVACPLCPRHFMGTSIVRPTLRQRHILAPQWNKFLADMDHIATKDHPVNMVFCGCHGDPPMTPDWEEIIINTANRNYIIDVEPICNVGEKYDKCPVIVGFNKDTPHRSFEEILKPIIQ